MNEIYVYIGMGIAIYVSGITRAILYSKRRLWTVLFTIVGLFGTLALLFAVGFIWPYQNGRLPEGAIIPSLLVSFYAGMKHSGLLRNHVARLIRK
jgi:hypothetical protein